MKALARFKKYLVFGVLVLLGVGWWLIRASHSGDIPLGITIEPVTRGVVSEIISETGLVVPAQEVNLSFERGGRVKEIPVTEGDKISTGDVLVRLDATQQSTDLITANARLNAEKLRLDELTRGADGASLAVTQSSVEIAKTALENAKQNLDEVTAQQNLLVQNALKTVRSSGLQAYLIQGEREDTNYLYSAPTVSGTYNSIEEGVYTISLYDSGAPSGSSFRVSGLETGTESVSTVNTAPLGSHGLFVQFPVGFAPRTVWEVPVPNTRSSSYQTNMNAYNATVALRTSAIASAESAIRSAEASLGQVQTQFTQVSSSARDERVSAQQDLVQQMQAAVFMAQFAQNNMTITAPFSGTITSVGAEVGEIVAPTAPVVSVISNENLELLVNISESDIQEINVGDTATISFDAYDSITSEAKVTSVAPTAKILDGVRVFEVRLQFSEKNDRIKPGLSANIDILAATRENAIAVASRAVIEKDAGKFVRALSGNKIEYIPVTVGLRGSNGMTEILLGLTEGQKIITFGQEDVIKQLESN